MLNKHVVHESACIINFARDDAPRREPTKNTNFYFAAAFLCKTHQTKHRVEEATTFFLIQNCQCVILTTDVAAAVKKVALFFLCALYCDDDDDDDDVVVCLFCVDASTLRMFLFDCCVCGKCDDRVSSLFST